MARGACRASFERDLHPRSEGKSRVSFEAAPRDALITPQSLTLKAAIPDRGVPTGCVTPRSTIRVALSPLGPKATLRRFRGQLPHGNSYYSSSPRNAIAGEVLVALSAGSKHASTTVAITSAGTDTNVRGSRFVTP